MTVDNSVAGHVIIVTGASKGVGRGIALHLARNGASLVITARKPEALESAAAELDAIGAPHLATTLNVADRDGAFALVDRTIAEFGRVDGLVANAQTFRSVTPFADITEHDMDVLLNTGPKGTLWGMQAVFPHMRDQGRGRIVTMGSNAALLGAAGYAPYASSKEAIRALTRSAAREWASSASPSTACVRSRPRTGHLLPTRIPNGHACSPRRTPTSRSRATATPRTTSGPSSSSSCPTPVAT